MSPSKSKKLSETAPNPSVSKNWLYNYSYLQLGLISLVCRSNRLSEVSGNLLRQKTCEFDGESWKLPLLCSLESSGQVLVQECGHLVTIIYNTSTVQYILVSPSIYLLQHSQQTCTTWSDNVLVFEQWDVQRPEETINLLKPTTWQFYHQKSTPFANTLYTSSQNNHTYLNSHRPKSAEIQRPMKHDRNRIYRRRNSFMHV